MKIIAIAAMYESRLVWLRQREKRMLILPQLRSEKRRPCEDFFIVEQLFVMAKDRESERDLPFPLPVVAV